MAPLGLGGKREGRGDSVQRGRRAALPFRRGTPISAAMAWGLGPRARCGLAPAALFALFSGACGGASATVEDGLVRGQQARYEIGALGEAWQRVTIAQNDLAWHHPGVGAVVQVNATCDPFQDVPLAALTNHLLIGFTDRTHRSSDRVSLDGREALRSHVVARLDGVERELLLYVLKKDECTYDFALVAPPGERFRRAAPDFERFVAGFRSRRAAP